jgi:titin
VSLSWSDNSSSESGFTVERSNDGVGYTAVASLGSNATSYTDNSLATRSTYWYQVRAFNAAGTSGASDPVVVTTLDEAPAAPESVAAIGSGTTAAVSWTDASSNETGFEIARESYNSKNRRWSGLTIVAAVPVDTTTYTDTPGSGTYRYSVRAYNDGGASGWAGPSGAVTVSGSASSGGGKGGGGKGGGKGSKSKK